MNVKLKREFLNLGFDPDKLREKYKHERDKRQRTDGDDQFIEIKDEYAHYADIDPYVEPGKGINNEVYTPGINEFNALLETWREQGDLEGLELR